MKNVLKRIILCKLFRKSLNKIANLAIANDRDLFETVLNNQNNHLKDYVDIYPSPFNFGYNHIEKAIKLVKVFNFNSTNAIIDVGAAKGDVSLIFASAFPYATIYSYEPILENFNDLQLNTHFNSKIKIFNKALGNSKEEKSIHLASRITSSSLLNIEENIENDFFNKNLKHIGEQKIIVNKLDNEISQDIQVNIIKIDVQGYELEVLKGARETLNRTYIILIEMQNHDLYNDAPKYYVLDEYLRKCGFVLFDIIPSIREDNKLYEWDGIYVNMNIYKK
jgi:FkbM family methyltransferase